MRFRSVLGSIPDRSENRTIFSSLDVALEYFTDDHRAGVRQLKHLLRKAAERTVEAVSRHQQSSPVLHRRMRELPGKLRMSTKPDFIALRFRRHRISRVKWLPEISL
jgi:hypothetical protein